jgi:DNA-binding XRE family transcriptional regulator
MEASSPNTSKMGKGSTWTKKISKNRGTSWRQNILNGRREALLNPTALRLTRLRKKVHQFDIATRLDISESTFGSIERGRRPVKPEQAKKIAGYFGVPVAKLFKPLASSRKNPSLKDDKLVAIFIKQEI